MLLWFYSPKLEKKAKVTHFYLLNYILTLIQYLTLTSTLLPLDVNKKLSGNHKTGPDMQVISDNKFMQKHLEVDSSLNGQSELLKR